METIKIIGTTIIAACIYGMAHDMVTAHVCVEYFLPPAHPVIFPTTSPVALALIWGIIATWWVGLFLGLPLAFVCRIGRMPKLTAKDMICPILVMLVILYFASMLSGVLGYFSTHIGVGLLPPLSTAVAPERHALFLFDIWAHGAAYLLGVVGGIVLMVWTWKKRRRLAKTPPD
ncbi:MAG: hypothetical protein FWH27_01555 [Planctomycetaceae bacterium]|nr:hypothetical protein [Planctomycetaceae bacterium]